MSDSRALHLIASAILCLSICILLAIIGTVAFELLRLGIRVVDRVLVIHERLNSVLVGRHGSRILTIAVQLDLNSCLLLTLTDVSALQILARLRFRGVR